MCASTNWLSYFPCCLFVPFPTGPPPLTASTQTFGHAGDDLEQDVPSFIEHLLFYSFPRQLSFNRIFVHACSVVLWPLNTLLRITVDVVLGIWIYLRNAALLPPSPFLPEYTRMHESQSQEACSLCFSCHCVTGDVSVMCIGCVYIELEEIVRGESESPCHVAWTHEHAHLVPHPFDVFIHVMCDQSEWMFDYIGATTYVVEVLLSSQVLLTFLLLLADGCISQHFVVEEARVRVLLLVQCGFSYLRHIVVRVLFTFQTLSLSSYLASVLCVVTPSRAFMNYHHHILIVYSHNLTRSP